MSIHTKVLKEHIPGLCWENGIVHPALESCCHALVIVGPFDMDQLGHKGRVNSYLVCTLFGLCPLSQYHALYHMSSCRGNRVYEVRYWATIPLVEYEPWGMAHHDTTGILFNLYRLCVVVYAQSSFLLFVVPARC